MKIVSFTGHREIDELRALKNVTALLVAEMPDAAIVGGAAGADTLAAECCWDLSIPYEMALPHPDYAKHYKLWNSDRWQQSFTRAKFVTFVVEEGPFHFSTNFKRNEFMVDACHKLISISTFDPHGVLPQRGGTAHCVRYALKVGRPIEWART